MGKETSKKKNIESLEFKKERINSLHKKIIELANLVELSHFFIDKRFDGKIIRKGYFELFDLVLSDTEKRKYLRFESFVKDEDLTIRISGKNLDSELEIKSLFLVYDEDEVPWGAKVSENTYVELDKSVLMLIIEQSFFG